MSCAENFSKTERVFYSYCEFSKIEPLEVQKSYVASVEAFFEEYLKDWGVKTKNFEDADSMVSPFTVPRRGKLRDKSIQRHGHLKRTFKQM